MQVTRVDLDKIKEKLLSIEKCWKEVDQREDMGMVLNIDWGIYKKIQEQGNLFLYALGKDGFISIIVSPEIHRKGHLGAVTDVMWLDKDQRGAFKEALPIIEEDLKERGVDMLSITVKSREEDEIYGYTLYEKTYQRKL